MTYTTEERGWYQKDWRDPRPDCPQRDRHAYRVYAERWTEPSMTGPATYPRLDGRSVARSPKQPAGAGCGRYMVWTARANSATTA